jgi:hypothetical protein
MAGGGMKMGQVIGATNRLAERAVSRPVTHQEIFATLFTNLGLNPNSDRVVDMTGRPQFLVDDGVQAIKELV